MPAIHDVKGHRVFAILAVVLMTEAAPAAAHNRPAFAASSFRNTMLDDIIIRIQWVVGFFVLEWGGRHLLEWHQLGWLRLWLRWVTRRRSWRLSAMWRYGSATHLAARRLMLRCGRLAGLARGMWRVYAPDRPRCGARLMGHIIHLPELTPEDIDQPSTDGYTQRAPKKKDNI